MTDLDFDTLDAFHAQFPRVAEIDAVLLAQDPAQEKYLTRRFRALTAPEAAHLETFAGLVTALCTEGLEAHVRDYLFLCDMQMQEEIHFRRTGRYRLSSFAEANAAVYQNRELMTKYMNGLLLTQLWWSNHTRMLAFYCDRFLAQNPAGYSHLEIGPGHGLLLFLACNDPNLAAAEAWDISEASVALTKHGLDRLAPRAQPALSLVDMFAAPDKRFDSIVFSEVLEHMEKPAEALAALHRCLSDDGRLFIHVPINSPALDHLFNTDTPDEMRAFVEACGFEIEEAFYAPMTNYALEKAVRNRLTVSCGFIARRRGAGNGI